MNVRDFTDEERELLINGLESFLRSLEAKRRNRQPKVLDHFELRERALAEELAKRIAVAP